jgi:hypothetical protein
MKRTLVLLLTGGLVLSFCFAGLVLIYTSISRVTGSSLQEREKAVLDLEAKRDEQVRLADHWQDAEAEYVAFRRKVLLKLDRFSELRSSLAAKIDANRLNHSGVSYQNRNSPDGKLIFVRFGFDVEGSYSQIKHLIWDLERMPHASRIGKMAMQNKDSGRLLCRLELEVVFEK